MARTSKINARAKQSQESARPDTRTITKPDLAATRKAKNISASPTATVAVTDGTKAGLLLTSGITIPLASEPPMAQ